MLTPGLALPRCLMLQKTNSRRQHVISIRGFVLNYESSRNRVAPEADCYGLNFNINGLFPALFCGDEIRSPPVSSQSRPSICLHKVHHYNCWQNISNMSTYLITQATGQQSRWVISYLLTAGSKIHAVVRDLQKIPPSLQHPNITLFEGESKNFEDILNAAQGCKGVFLNTFPYPGLEALQAKTVVEACQKAGVETIVAATTHGTANKAMWDDEATKEINLHQYFSSKATVEEIVRAGGFQAYTILRPAVIHHDFFVPGCYGNFPRLPTHGELDHLLEDGAKVPYTDANDIGKYAAAALQDPTKFAGQEINLGNELLTIEEARDILTKVSGRQVRATKRTQKEVEDMGISVFGQAFHLLSNIKDFSWTTASAKEVQNKFGIPFTSLEAAVQRDRALLLECLPAE